MALEYNLIDRPWIPCIRQDGTAVELGLRDVLAQAHTLRDLAADTPLENAALYRLLLAITHRTFGPDTYDGWAQMRGAGRLDAPRLERYWGQQQAAFDLFSPSRPFYQAADDRVQPKPVNSLILDLAFGNKATLFDHHTDTEALSLAPGKAARALVALQSFGLAGLSGLKETFTDGPCARGAVIVVHGTSVFETLMLNLIRYPTRDDVFLHHDDDAPAWEQDDPFTPNRTRPHGYLDYLTWQSRRVTLLAAETEQGVRVNEITMAPGLRLDAEVLEPMHHYRRDEKRGHLVLRFSEDRALWRDSVPLLRLRSDGDRPPQAFGWLSELIEYGLLDQHETRRYLALGMANNQAKVDFYRSERLPLPLVYLTPEGAHLTEALDTALELAGGVRAQLWGAARTMAQFVLAPQSDAEEAHTPARQDLDNLTTRWAVERAYWVHLEIPFHHLVETLPADVDAALSEWCQTLRQVAWRAFDHLASQIEQDPRNLKAAVRGRGQLAAGLAKALPQP